MKIVVRERASDSNLLPELDAVLVGFIALNDPATAIITEDWIESSKWQRVARALLRHRRRGGQLGDIFLATEALLALEAREGLGNLLPGTLIAEAMMATTECVSAAHVVEQARLRLPRLRLRRLAELLLVTASSEPEAIVRIARSVAPRMLEEIASGVQP